MQKFKVGDLVQIKDTGYFGLENGRLAGRIGIVVKLYDKAFTLYTTDTAHVFLSDGGVGIVRGFYYYELTLLASNE